MLVGDELEIAGKKKKPGKTGIKSQSRIEKLEERKPTIEKSPSLKATIDKINTISKNKEIIESDNIDLSIDPGIEEIKLSQENLNLQYEVFLDKIKKEQPRLHTAMKVQSPVLNNSLEVEMNFQNNALMEEFRHRLKPSLISHLCGSLGIQSIAIVEKIIDSTKLKKPKLFNDTEKFRKLSQKNPALQKLKNMFNLDFE